VVSIVDSSDKVVATYTADKAFSSVVFSSSVITNGETYTIYVGGSASGDTVGGLATSGSIEGATNIGTVTAGQHSGGQGGPGGR